MQEAHSNKHSGFDDEIDLELFDMSSRGPVVKNSRKTN